MIYMYNNSFIYSEDRGYHFRLNKNKTQALNMYIFIMQNLLLVCPAKPTRGLAEERNN